MEDNPYYDYPVTAFTDNARVAMHPATDLYMRGARYGNVVKAGPVRVTVRLDSGRTATVPRTHIRPVDE